MFQIFIMWPSPTPTSSNSWKFLCPCSTLQRSKYKKWTTSSWEAVLCWKPWFVVVFLSEKTEQWSPTPRLYAIFISFLGFCHLQALHPVFSYINIGSVKMSGNQIFWACLFYCSFHSFYWRQPCCWLCCHSVKVGRVFQTHKYLHMNIQTLQTTNHICVCFSNKHMLRRHLK